MTNLRQTRASLGLQMVVKQIAKETDTHTKRQTDRQSDPNLLTSFINQATHKALPTTITYQT